MQTAYHRITITRVLPAVLLVVLAAVLPASIDAQSGRKLPKSTTKTETPPPPPPKEGAEDTSTSSAPDATPVTVEYGVRDLSSNGIAERIVLDGILKRLADVRSLKPSGSGQDINRKQASDLAKNSKDAYVLWFELGNDRAGFQSSGSSSDYVQNLYVDYVIFSPGTGKPKSSGHVYQRQNAGVGGVPPGVPRTTMGTAEYTLYYAGRETADRLLDALGKTRLPQIPH